MLKIQDEILGEIIYEKDKWRKAENLNVNICNKNFEITIDILILNSLYIEYLYNLNDELQLSEEDFEDELDDINDFFESEKNIYAKFLSDKILFQENLEKVLRKELFQYNSIAERLKEAVFETLRFKVLHILEDRIEIEMSADWAEGGDIGLILYDFDDYVIGTVDILS